APATEGTPEQKWARAIESFGKALVDGDQAAGGQALAAKPAVRRVDSSAAEEAWRIFDRVDKSTLVGQHAYLHPPLVMAADVAADFKNAASIAEDAKNKFAIEDRT